MLRPRGASLAVPTRRERGNRAERPSRSCRTLRLASRSGSPSRTSVFGVWGRTATSGSRTFRLFDGTLPQSPDETDMTRDMPTGRLVPTRTRRSTTPHGRSSGRNRRPGCWSPASARCGRARIGGTTDRPTSRRSQAASRGEETRSGSRAPSVAEARTSTSARGGAAEVGRGTPSHRKGVEDAHALEAFFEAVGRRAETMQADAKAELHERISKARTLLGSDDVIQRFLKWRMPSAAAVEDDDEDS